MRYTKSYFKKRMAEAKEEADTIGERVLFLMNKKGVDSVGEFCDMTLITRSVADRIINNREGFIRPIYIKIIADFLDSTPDYIMNGLNSRVKFDCLTVDERISELNVVVYRMAKALKKAGIIIECE
jgi:hypothetical protein